MSAMHACVTSENRMALFLPSMYPILTGHFHASCTPTTPLFKLLYPYHSQLTSKNLICSSSLRISFESKFKNLSFLELNRRMNGKKGCIEINIPSMASTKSKLPENSKMGAGVEELSFKAWVSNVWHFVTEDSDRVIFSLKVGLAVLLVSLLILFQAPYDIFGTNIIWSILTVAIMFEFTVGATFNRGFNRALGSLLAGILAIAVGQIALHSGRVVEPFVIGISIFAVGTTTSFLKQWPSLVPYEYGFRVILFTYCLIIVSGFRMGTPIRTAMDRLYSIAIGAFVAVLVNVLVFPMWAGEQLHKELVKNFNSVADSLEECVKKYLEEEGLDQEFSKTVMDEFPDEPAYRRCKTTLNSSAKLESLANAAKWELPHGRFRHFFYPWAEYVKVGAVLRYCAYEVMALHGVLHSEIQACYNLRVTFQSEIRDAASCAAELVRGLGRDISDMKRSTSTLLRKKVLNSTERLQRAIDTHSYLLVSNFDPSVNKLQHTMSLNPPAELSDVSPVDTNETNTAASGPQQQVEAAASYPYYDQMVRKQSRRQHSWPSREVDAYEEEGGGLSMDLLPKMKALETTAALSLATFTSLLIELVARLDHLVEAVDELSKMAKFKREGV